ncbi:helix-turn-helix domain-containing protein [Lentisalinibacter orientalis]|uniref:helix-turn-helix domain-containing protein n=1 Tax=Lentisalinibacter orientalis TaxID=2992241 RepID=UPI00386A3034
MTMSSSYAEQISDRLPSESERVAANQLRRILAADREAGDGQRLKIVDESGKSHEIILAPALSNLLMSLLEHIESGDAVTLVPVEQRLTTQQAADLLNVSRPYLVGMLEKGKIPFERVGRHRRIRAEDLFAYKKSRDAKREAALQELTDLDSELI